MEYYNLPTSEQCEIKNILNNDLYMLANELGEHLFNQGFESGELVNFEYDEEYEEYPEILQWWCVSDWLAEKLIEDGEVVNQVKGVNLWGRCGCGYAVECDFVNIYKSLSK